jgi:hypothetical protein
MLNINCSFHWCGKVRITISSFRDLRDVRHKQLFSLMWRSEEYDFVIQGAAP